MFKPPSTGNIIIAGYNQWLILTGIDLSTTATYSFSFVKVLNGLGSAYGKQYNDGTYWRKIIEGFPRGLVWIYGGNRWRLLVLLGQFYQFRRLNFSVPGRVQLGRGAVTGSHAPSGGKATQPLRNYKLIEPYLEELLL